MSRYWHNINIKTRRAIIDYSMIENDDGIMVGLSGGKDSLTLLIALKSFLKRSKHKFPLVAGYIGLDEKSKQNNQHFLALKKFCNSIEIPLFYEPTNIRSIVFDIRQEKNPCSLCAKMRRGALNNLAKKNNFNKIALGHHRDDVIETLMLNIFYAGKIDAFKPVTWLSRKDITVIRPLVYVAEKDIKNFAKAKNLPITNDCCPASGFTKRQEMKDILKIIEEHNPQAQDLAISALINMPNNPWSTTRKK